MTLRTSLLLGGKRQAIGVEGCSLAAGRRRASLGAFLFGLPVTH